MKTYQPARLLCLHLTERDQHGAKPLYEAIVEKCRELQIAGATVFRGVEGYSETAEIHRPRVLRQDLPLVVEIVDSAEKIKELATAVEPMIGQGLITIADVQILRIQKSKTAQF